MPLQHQRIDGATLLMHRVFVVHCAGTPLQDQRIGIGTISYRPMQQLFVACCTGKALQYRRIDGGSALDDRERAIQDFNRPGSDVFIFLLSIRAAGRGLNLQVRCGTCFPMCLRASRCSLPAAASSCQRAASPLPVCHAVALFI